MCDDEEDLFQPKSTIFSSNKYTSDNLFNNKTTLDNNSLFDKKSSPNQGLLSSKPFKLNRHSSFNDSSLRSKKLFSPISPPLSPIIKQQQHTNSTPIHISPVNRLNNYKPTLDTTHIPLIKQRPLFRPHLNNITRISSPSPRPLFNDKQQHSSSTYVYLRNPSSPVRVNS
jgi:hypothetical protein